MLPIPLRFSFRWSFLARPLAPGLAREAERRFELLVDAHLDAICRTARRLGVPDREVEDLVQEVLVVVSRRLADIEADKERAFALGTTARVAANFRRRARRREVLLGDVEEVCGGNPFQSFGGVCGEQQVEQAEALALLRAGLDAMTESQRVTFVLFELEELRAGEIAKQLGIAEAVVVSRLHRARVVMRRVCERRRILTTAGRAERGEEHQS